MPQDYKYGEITSVIIAAAMEVHGIIRSGFQEAIYQRSLLIELELRKLKAASECEMPLYYKGVQVGMRRVDILVEGKICVELKAVAKLDDLHLAQALNYLEAFNLEVGLLINFGSKSLEVKRVHNKKYNPQTEVAGSRQFG